jgi:polysaccharide pyruvyl transferase WcaK-like protein
MRDYLAKQREFDTEYVMLPQAFGPFEEAELAEAFTAVANAASVLFVRDDRSREYIVRAQRRDRCCKSTGYNDHCSCRGAILV